jgi:hypothetical protein
MLLLITNSRPINVCQPVALMLKKKKTWSVINRLWPCKWEPMHERVMIFCRLLYNLIMWHKN